MHWTHHDCDFIASGVDSNGDFGKWWLNMDKFGSSSAAKWLDNRNMEIKISVDIFIAVNQCGFFHFLSTFCAVFVGKSWFTLIKPLFFNGIPKRFAMNFCIFLCRENILKIQNWVRFLSSWSRQLLVFDCLEIFWHIYPLRWNMAFGWKESKREFISLHKYPLHWYQCILRKNVCSKPKIWYSRNIPPGGDIPVNHLQKPDVGAETANETTRISNTSLNKVKQSP